MLRNANATHAQKQEMTLAASTTPTKETEAGSSKDGSFKTTSEECQAELRKLAETDNSETEQGELYNVD